MPLLTDKITSFLHRQSFLVVTTLDGKGFPHNSCKGMVEIEGDKVYLLDLYRGDTFKNLKRNPHVSVTAVDEHKFVGYSLKGKGKIIKRGDLNPRLMDIWEKKIVKRITHRVHREVTGTKGHHHQPEVSMPKPKYLIEVDIGEVVDLAKYHK